MPEQLFGCKAVNKTAASVSKKIEVLLAKLSDDDLEDCSGDPFVESLKALRGVLKLKVGGKGNEGG